MRCFVFHPLLLLLICLPLQAANVVDLLPDGSLTALMIKKEGKITTQIHQQQLLPPASTLKLVTALAAKLELGDNFRYQTQLIRHGDDVIVRFSGDPSLTRQDLEQLFSNLQTQQIIGDIILDDRAYTGYQHAVGWPWDILGVCYSTLSSALNLDGNCVQAALYTNNDGSTRVHVPEFQSISVTSDAQTVSAEVQQQNYCDLELTTSPDNHYHLSGCIIPLTKPLPLNFAVQNPYLYISAAITAELQQQDIPLTGQIRLWQAGKDQDDANEKLLATHQSAALPELLEHMLKESDNLYANNLAKTLGAQRFHQAGSFTNGAAATKQVLAEKAGIDLTNAVLEDGSGLSRNNRLTASQLMSVLDYIAKHNNKLHLIELLPIAGESGTLKYRPSMHNEPIKGHIIAKSGSLFGSHNMAGFALDKEGQPSTVFVQLVSNYHPVKNEDDSNQVPPITQFETQFYQQLLNDDRHQLVNH